MCVIQTKLTMTSLSIECNLICQPLGSGWVVYGSENEYTFPFPRLLRIKQARAITINSTREFLTALKNKQSFPKRMHWPQRKVRINKNIQSFKKRNSMGKS